MTQAYKIAADIVDKIKTLRGQDGSLLAPVQDINGDWFISIQEMEAEEFQIYKEKYPNIVGTFVLCEYVAPKKDIII